MVTYVSCAGYNRLENDHPLCVRILIPNSVELHPKSLEKPLLDPSRGYVIAVGGQKNYIFPSLLPLTILFNTAIQVCSRIMVQPILVNAEDYVIGRCEAISREEALSH